MALTTDVPQMLQPALERAGIDLQELAEMFEPESWALPIVRTRLLPVFACSPFVLDLCQRRPEYLRDALVHPLDQTRPDDATPGVVIPAMVATHLAQQLGEDSLMVELRQYRNTEMLRIVIADLLGYADVPKTLADVTALADASIQGAEQFIHQTLTERFGQPQDSEGRAQRLIVLAMGKLGGFELNFSSDVDLICAYRSAGVTVHGSSKTSEGDRTLDNEVFFRRVTQGIARILGKRTEDGFVFRVDLRLRPFGDSGPLVMNFDGLENYYLTQGREWERYAMIKARPVCGLPEDCAEITALLEPFVYRRYLDYSAFESLRDLKQRIAAQVQQKGMQDNIKLGPGGIREIEFTGQAFQLVRGGREPSLQQRPILAVLKAVKQLDLLPESDVAALEAAYLYLRRTENYLQMMRDEQVHAIPQSEEDKTRLRFAMGYATWDALVADLTSHRAQVQSLFQSLFHTDTDDDSETSADPLQLLWLSGASDDSHVVELQDLGFERPDEARAALAELADSAFYRNLTQQAQQRLDRLVPMMLRAVAKQSGSWRALQGLLRLVRGIAGRSVYLQVLVETPAALELMTRLFSRSSFIADFVCQHPIVIDELLDYRHIENPPDRESMERDVAFTLERVATEDLDVQMDAFRQFQQAHMIRIAAAELEGQLDLMRVSDRLTWLAELTLQAVSDLVWDQMIERYGRPHCRVEDDDTGVGTSPADNAPEGRTPEGRTPEGRTPGFSIVAYGKMGGLELSYASDLDIVFLHESEGTMQQTLGPKVVENQVFFARLAQKIVHFISTLTPAGVLYEVDTRLRPNGQSGMLVSSLAAFELYHQQEAWTWEHQALVRARVVVGNQRIRQRFGAIRSEVLCRQREAEVLRQDVASMRQRMRSELGTSGENFDLKQDVGGIADIEFMVQYMVLWKASEHPELTTDTDNVRLLERIGSLGFVSATMAADLHGAYLEFRRFTHRLALLDQKAIISPAVAASEWSTEELSALTQHRERVQMHWQQLMEPVQSD